MLNKLPTFSRSSLRILRALRVFKRKRQRLFNVYFSSKNKRVVRKITSSLLSHSYPNITLNGIKGTIYSTVICWKSLLHIHTEHSLLEGNINIKSLSACCKCKFNTILLLIIIISKMILIGVNKQIVIMGHEY